MDPNQKFLRDEGELFEDIGRYCCLVGMLNNLTITKPIFHMQLILLVKS
jgi:hypothetical protein